MVVWEDSTHRVGYSTRETGIRPRTVIVEKASIQYIGEMVLGVSGESYAIPTCLKGAPSC